ncbi:Pantoate--beta-alanine ligase [Lachnellula subtilissima]|uniref:Pantoate--beta-alanine ligase n=1 Tax=Lachnellula subtilissima TaxID=602034 RepID=A0A8H8U7N2_9HELO|nr:Pantoate--beta-alanine ligase [Lachnellula subtilissima]
MFSRSHCIAFSSSNIRHVLKTTSPRCSSSYLRAFHFRSKGPVIPRTSIKIFREISELQAWRRKQLLDYRTVGLVPTMGALHEGHLSLIRMAAAENHRVVVSVYVNPTQFGVHEDLDSYPKTWEKDCGMLKDLDKELAEDGNNLGGIAAVFAPTTETMYPSGRPDQEVNAKGSFVTITPVGEVLEGASRPTFFRGVATVCMKLFNIVMPEKVYFGQKDVQQTVVIKKMVKDFCMNTQVVVGDTQRAPDGLALSSRNLLLMEQHQLPPEEQVNFEIDYISLADPETMQELDEVDETKGAIISGAVKMLPVEVPQPGEDLGLSDGPPVRLIDNIVLKPVKL